MKKITTLLLLFICIALSCERDDICSEDTPTTPRMIVEFRDLILTDNPKNVTGLRVEDFEDDTRLLEDFNNVIADQIVLPLDTNRDELGVGITKYRVYRDYEVLADGTIEGNPDVITIEYGVEDVYVSRACGFKTTYKNIVITIEPDADNWMLFVAPENDNQTVTNENEIHFTIRH
ncbi:DUF6452 family protein [Lacinutrix sp.]|uniref:DUF6452 family protein n=1 Tax=Lacinutrix sp. TaxID=1937692 RepID=UPI0025C538D7|nr:DUF6452 family protein [Lacinutrix sp.]